MLREAYLVKRDCFVEKPTVISTEVPVSAFAESTGTKWRNLLKSRFIDSSATRSK